MTFGLKILDNFSEFFKKLDTRERERMLDFSLRTLCMYEKDRKVKWIWKMLLIGKFR